MLLLVVVVAAVGTCVDASSQSACPGNWLDIGVVFDMDARTQPGAAAEQTDTERAVAMVVAVHVAAAVDDAVVV